MLRKPFTAHVRHRSSNGFPHPRGAHTPSPFLIRTHIRHSAGAGSRARSLEEAGFARFTTQVIDGAAAAIAVWLCSSVGPDLRLELEAPDYSYRGGRVQVQKPFRLQAAEEPSGTCHERFATFPLSFWGGRQVGQRKGTETPDSNGGCRHRNIRFQETLAVRAVSPGGPAFWAKRPETPTPPAMLVRAATLFAAERALDRRGFPTAWGPDGGAGRGRGFQSGEELVTFRGERGRGSTEVKVAGRGSGFPPNRGL